MPTTTNYGWTTPADTDLVKDGASAIRTLGTAIDTTVYNNAQAAIAKTIVDAKGDLIAATAADTVSRIAVGANDTVLTADSSTATGLKWSAPVAAIPANATATVATQETTSSDSYTDLTTAGPAVTLTTGTKALVILSSNMRDREDRGWFMSYAVSGATTIAAADTRALSMVTPTQPAGIYQVSFAHVVTSLTAGSNTFTAKYRTISTAHSAVFKDRSIFVINLA